jgi:predicted P-loop ATPase/GTPase
MKRIILFVFCILFVYPTLAFAKNVTISFVPLKHVYGAHYTLLCTEVLSNISNSTEITVKNMDNNKKRIDIVLTNLTDSSDYLCTIESYNNFNEPIYSSVVFTINTGKQKTQPPQKKLEIQIQ